MDAVNQSRQLDDSIFQPLQIVLVPPGGSAFLNIVGGPLPTERDVEGFAAIAGFLVSGPLAPFSLNIYQYAIPGFLIPSKQISSSVEPITGQDRIDFTEKVTGKIACFEVFNPGPAPIVVVAHIKLRPVSCYDQDIVFDPSDVLTVKFQKGGTVSHFNGNSGGVSTPLFAANANRIEVFGVNLGPRPITMAFGVAAVYGAGQTIPANTPFKFDRESGLSLDFIDDGGPGGAVVSATEISLP
jgi:hypothetical protein